MGVHIGYIVGVCAGLGCAWIFYYFAAGGGSQWFKLQEAARAARGKLDDPVAPVLHSPLAPRGDLLAQHGELVTKDEAGPRDTPDLKWIRSKLVRAGKVGQDA